MVRAGGHRVLTPIAGSALALAGDTTTVGVGIKSRGEPRSSIHGGKLVVEVNARTSAVMLRLDRVAQRIGLTIVGCQDGRARRFVAWGREIEYVALDTGVVRASALVDEEVMASSTRSVEWMQGLMRRARADQLLAAAARANVPSRTRFGPRPTEASPWQARLDDAPAKQATPPNRARARPRH